MQDLWADLNGDSPAKEIGGRGGGLRQRRLTEQAVLAALRAWLLQEYVIPYGASLGAARIFKRCYWIDALGANRQSAQELPQETKEDAGSESAPGRKRARTNVAPALQPLASVARQFAQLERPISLHGFILDGKSGKQKRGGESKPQVQPEQAVLAREGGVLHAGWPEQATALLAALEGSAAIFLLNPLKDGLFRYTDLAPLYQRTAPTELLVWLSHKQLETLLPRLRSGDAAAALTNLLHGDRWKTLLAGEKPGAPGNEEIIDGLVDLFAESMRPHFLSVQRVAFPVWTGPALVEAVPYSLIFATRRQDSLNALNDALYHRLTRLRAESQQGTLSESWFTEQREAQASELRAELDQAILTAGRASRARRWPELRQQLLLKHFGHYPLQEYDRAIVELLARGEVRCDWRRSSQENQENMLPGTNDLLIFAPEATRKRRGQ